jgi:hypothetical protein
MNASTRRIPGRTRKAERACAASDRRVRRAEKRMDAEARRLRRLGLGNASLGGRCWERLKAAQAQHARHERAPHLAIRASQKRSSSPADLGYHLNDMAPTPPGIL